jgi:hypothetical protein
LQPNSIAAGVAHGTEPRTPQNRTSISECEDDSPGIPSRDDPAASPQQKAWNQWWLQLSGAGDGARNGLI